MKFLTPIRFIAIRPLFFPQMSTPYSTSSDNSRGGSRSNRRNDSPTVALSKQLSWLLRHHLDKSGLQVRTDGYVRVDDIVPPLPLLTL